jgi:hypothetical protein
MARSEIVTKLQELNQRLAALYLEASAAGLPINSDWDNGCPPCNTVDDEDSCVGCPYRMRDNGFTMEHDAYSED